MIYGKIVAGKWGVKRSVIKREKLKMENIDKEDLLIKTVNILRNRLLELHSKINEASINKDEVNALVLNILDDFEKLMSLVNEALSTIQSLNKMIDRLEDRVSKLNKELNFMGELATKMYFGWEDEQTPPKRL